MKDTDGLQALHHLVLSSRAASTSRPGSVRRAAVLSDSESRGRPVGLCELTGPSKSPTSPNDLQEPQINSSSSPRNSSPPLSASHHNVESHPTWLTLNRLHHRLHPNLHSSQRLSKPSSKSASTARQRARLPNTSSRTQLQDTRSIRSDSALM